jgi:hypothetical protein
VCDPIIVRYRRDLAVPCEVDIDSSGQLVIDVHTGLRHERVADLVAQVIGEPCVACGLDADRRAIRAMCAATAALLADTA